MSAASIYAKRKTTNQLQDAQYSAQIQSYRTGATDSTGVQQQQMEQQQRQYREIRLPQERLQQGGNGGGGGNRFSAFKSQHRNSGSGGDDGGGGNRGAGAKSPDSAAPAPAVQREQAKKDADYEFEQSRSAHENRFELFYSRSCPASRKHAEQVLQGLESYFADSFIRKHVVAIDFDDSSNVGPVHEAILKTERYLALIQSDCLLYDKFKNYIVLPDQNNILKVLKTYCQSLAPKPVSPPMPQRRLPSSQQQQSQQQSQQSQQLPRDAAAARRIAGNVGQTDNNDLVVPMPPRGMVGFSTLAKHVGADINSPTADVKIVSQVPSRANALLLAQTADEMAALPPSNVSSVYAKNRGVTLGYGEDMDAITKAFVERHNACNPLDRDISLPKQQQRKGNKEAQVIASLKRTAGDQQQQQLRQPQHLQGLADAPFVNEDTQQQQQQQQQRRRLPTPLAASSSAAPQPSSENEQLGVIRQVKVKK